MRRILSTLVFLLAVSVAYCQSPAKRYTSKSGKILYNYELDGMQTSYKLVFDEFGEKQVFELEYIEDGVTQKTRTIITPETLYIVNYEDEQVIKFPVDTDGESMKMYSGEAAGFDVSGIAAEVTADASGKKGTGTIINKRCDIYEYTDREGAKGRYWIYKGYLLKAEFIDNVGQHAYMEAKDLKLDIPIEASEFEVPSDFQVQDMTKMMEQMKQMRQMYGVPDQE